MKKLKKIISSFLVFLVLMGVFVNHNTKAAGNCKDFSINIENISKTEIIGWENDEQTVNIDIKGLSTGATYYLGLSLYAPELRWFRSGDITIDEAVETFVVSMPMIKGLQDSKFSITLYENDGILQDSIICDFEETINYIGSVNCFTNVYQERYLPQENKSLVLKKCSANKNSCIDSINPVKVETILKMPSNKNKPWSPGIAIYHDISSSSNATLSIETPSKSGRYISNLGRLSIKSYDLETSNSIFSPNEYISFCDGFTFSVTKNTCEQTDDCIELDPSEEIPTGGTNDQTPQPYSLCDQIPATQAAQKAECLTCVGGATENEAGNKIESQDGVWTAFGCIKREPTNIIQQLIKIGLGIAGGLTLLTFLAAGFQYSIAQNDAKMTAQAREQITASLIGLLFILFSVTILQFIGSSVLKIPGFGG